MLMTRRYPGKAVDASLSLEQPNAMDTIYRNNWLNAHESIRTTTPATTIGDGDDLGYPDGIRFANGSDGSVSSLGKYQMTLEQIRLLDLQNKDPSVTQAIKDLSGYKPSTLRRKNRRHYPGWDDLIETQPTPSDVPFEEYPVYEEAVWDSPQSTPRKGSYQSAKANSISKSSKSNGTSPTYANVNPHNRSPTTKLKRSQTMRESNQTQPIFCSTLDIKDIFRRRPLLNEAPLACDRTLPSRRQGGSSGSNSNASSTNSSANSSKKSSAELIDDNQICDRNAGRANVSGHFRSSMYDTGSDEDSMVLPIEVQPKYSRDPSTRMRKGSDRVATPGQWTGEVNRSNVQRAKSVRIQNDHQVIADHDSVIRSPPTAAKRNTNKFNTIARGNDHHDRPPVIEFYPQRSNTLKKLPSILKTSPTNSVNGRPSPPAAARPSGSFSSAVANGSPITLEPPTPRRNGASASSVDSDELFSIPRPRLIVPVHTYARKRRTGNLLNAVADEDDQEEEDDVSSTMTMPNGKLTLLILFKPH